MKTPGGETNQSPEHQMTKLREQARSGGYGRGGGYGDDEKPDVPVSPRSDQKKTNNIPI